MNSWPIDDRNQTTPQIEKKREIRTKQECSARNYSSVHPGSNAATLVAKNGTLEWSFLSTNATQGPKLHIGKCRTIFPPSRPASDDTIKRTVLQSVERGSNFLRTLHPDVDIPVEVIRRELVQDMQVDQKLKVFDPYKGNLLESIVTSDRTALAFSMGELNRELNLSPLRQSDSRTVFEPSARPAFTFDTPIQQIAVSPPLVNVPYLAVRNFGSTSLLGVTSHGKNLSLTEATVISHADTGGRALVDISLPMTPMEMLVVNDLGSLYHCSVFGGQKHICMVHSTGGDVINDSFWRLSRGADNMSWLLASKDTLTQFDLRTNIPQRLFYLSEPSEVLTGIEDQDKHHIIKLCSTREILWIDARFPGKPLLGYRHGRQHDRTLQSYTSPTFSALTWLYSRGNAMITVYDISRSDTQLFHVNSPPYCFFPSHTADVSHLGQTLVSDPYDSSSLSLIRLTERGSLHHVDLSLSGLESSVFDISWSKEIGKIETKSSAGGNIPHDDQAFIEVDFSSAFDCMFTKYLESDKERHTEVTDCQFEAIPTFWQEAEPPVQHMLTTFDVMFRAGDPPNQLARSDFLTEGTVNSRSGYQAIAQERLASEVVARGAAWHNNLNATLHQLGLIKLSNDVQSVADALSRHDLVKDPKRSAQTAIWEKEAREQLALDLVLSSDTYSTQPILNPSVDKSKLEDMTSLLSIADEPPLVEFGFLRPVSSESYPGADEPGEFRTTMGVRSLLKDWDIGTDVEKYEYSKRAPESIVGQENSSRVPEPQRKKPPKVTAIPVTSSQPPEVERRNLMTHSQDSGLPGFIFQDVGISQETMANTQILPGAYGGRPSVNRKKAGKKRVGGF